jgi:hypothetical protein
LAIVQFTKIAVNDQIVVDKFTTDKVKWIHNNFDHDTQC